LGLFDLGAIARLLDLSLADESRLECRRLLLLLRRGLVGLRRGDAGVTLDRGGVRGGEVLDVACVVLDLLDLEGVDYEAELLHLVGRGGFHLLRDAVPIPDDLLNAQAADDRAEVPGKHL